MNKQVKVTAIFIVLVLVVWLISAKTKPYQTSQDTIYKIGVLLPLSGDAAIYGEPAKNVYQLAVEEINSQGGVNGKKLELIIEDDKCSGKDGASAAQKLINVDKVQILLGSLCSSVTIPVVTIAQQNKVLFFSPGATSPELTGISPYFFRNVASDDSQGQVDAEIAYRKGFRKVAFIVEQKDYPLGIYGAFKKRFEALGGEVIKEEFPVDSTDFRSQLIKLKNQNPDVLFIDPQAPPAGERIIKQVEELAWKPQLFITETEAGDQKFLQDHKDFLEGSLGSQFVLDLTNPKSKHLLEDYKQKYGVELAYQSYGHTEYDSIYLLKFGIQQVGYNGEKLAAWSRTIKNWPGASGSITVNSAGDREGGYTPQIVKNGLIQNFFE